MKFVQLGQIDRIAPACARGLHLPEVAQRADRRLDAGIDLNAERFSLELLERGCARHPVQDVDLAVSSEELHAHGTAKRFPVESKLHRVPRAQAAEDAGQGGHVGGLGVGNQIQVAGGSDDAVRAACKSADDDIPDTRPVQFLDYPFWLERFFSAHLGGPRLRI